jgi:hypothetical protein
MQWRCAAVLLLDPHGIGSLLQEVHLGQRVTGLRLQAAGSSAPPARDAGQLLQRILDR